MELLIGIFMGVSIVLLVLFILDMTKGKRRHWGG